MIGIWQDQLIVSMNHGELISINILTGKILWKTHNLVKNILRFNAPYKWRGLLLYMHIENGKIYEFSGSIYYSIDLETQAVEILWEDKRGDGYISVRHPTYTEDSVYFTGSFNIRFQPNVLGIFNRKTLTIEWAEELSLALDPSLGYVASLNQAPQVTDKEIYVKDSEGNLYIFEREII